MTENEIIRSKLVGIELDLEMIKIKIDVLTKSRHKKLELPALYVEVDILERQIIMLKKKLQMSNFGKTILND